MSHNNGSEKGNLVSQFLIKVDPRGFSGSLTLLHSTAFSAIKTPLHVSNCCFLSSTLHYVYVSQSRTSYLKTKLSTKAFELVGTNRKTTLHPSPAMTSIAKPVLYHLHFGLLIFPRLMWALRIWRYKRQCSKIRICWDSSTNTSWKLDLVRNLS